MPQTADDAFTAYIDTVIGKEGGYSNDANDSGGETMWGITIAEARAHGYTGPMKGMPRDTAVGIYRQTYWTGPGLDKLYSVSPILAAKLLDTGINMGTGTAIKFLQRALNVLNKGGTAWPDLNVDGGLGEKTLAALMAFFKQRGKPAEAVMLFMVCAQQSVRYIDIAEKDGTQEDFEYGWQLNRALAAA